MLANFNVMVCSGFILSYRTKLISPANVMYFADYDYVFFLCK